MLVNEIATRNAKTCSPEDNLAVAAWMMWEGDCGVVPVVSREGKVLGVVTDRDICMAVATRPQKATDINVQQVMAEDLVSCRPDDDVREALEKMQEEQIRRLPVVDTGGRLFGMLSINDIILADKNSTELSDTDVIVALKAICEHKVRNREEALHYAEPDQPKAKDETADTSDTGGL